MSGWPAGLLRIQFFGALSFCSLASRIMVADGLAQAPKPGTSPCEFDTEDRKTHGNDDQGRTGRDEHHHADQQHSGTHDSDDNPPRRFVAEMHCSFDQSPSPSFLPRLAVALD